MNRRLNQIAVSLLLLGPLALPALAYNPAPSGGDLAEAIAFGTQAQDYAELVRGHRFSSDSIYHSIVVYTPWLSVAAAAGEAKRKYLPFTIADARRIAERERNSVMLVGGAVDDDRFFWRQLHVVILQDGGAHQPARVDANLGKVDCGQYGRCSYIVSWSATFPRRFNAWKDAVAAVTWTDMEYRVNLPFSKIR